MRARQIAETHQEFADDLAAHEAEGLGEKPHPGLLGKRMMRIEPGGEGAVGLSQNLQPPGILDHRINLEAVADDRGIKEKTRPVRLAERRYAIDVEAGKGRAERLALLEDGEPGKTGLVDLEREALEENRILARR